MDEEEAIIFNKIQQTVKNKRFNMVYGGPSIKLVHLRHLWLKTNGNNQNNKRQKIYETKLRHFIVKGPN